MVHHLEELLEDCSVVPHVNQVRFSILLEKKEKKTMISVMSVLWFAKVGIFTVL